MTVHLRAGAAVGVLLVIGVLAASPAAGAVEVTDPWPEDDTSGYWQDVAPTPDASPTSEPFLEPVLEPVGPTDGATDGPTDGPRAEATEEATDGPTDDPGDEATDDEVNELAPVPWVVGLTQEDAAAAIRRWLRVAVADFRNERPAGVQGEPLVVRQDEPQDDPDGVLVPLTLGVRMPDVVTMPPQTAVEMVSGLGLGRVQVRRTADQDGQGPFVVARQEPRSGDLVAYRTPVTLVAEPVAAPSAQGPAEPPSGAVASPAPERANPRPPTTGTVGTAPETVTVVPDLRGLGVDEAREATRAAELALRVTGAGGVVTVQEPPADAVVPVRTVVRVALGTAPGGDATAVPDRDAATWGWLALAGGIGLLALAAGNELVARRGRSWVSRSVRLVPCRPQPEVRDLPGVTAPDLSVRLEPWVPAWTVKLMEVSP